MGTGVGHQELEWSAPRMIPDKAAWGYEVLAAVGIIIIYHHGPSRTPYATSNFQKNITRSLVFDTAAVLLPAHVSQ